MNAFLAAVLILTPSGLDLFKHHKSSRPCCEACGTETARVHALICTMRSHPRWQARDDAAHALRKFDARCHPEIGSALATTMLFDRHEEVREEAAESLAKLAPCQPDVHEALVRAAQCDPDHATRKWANRALKNLKAECADPCNVCAPIAAATPTRYLAPARPPGYALPLNAPLPAWGSAILPVDPYQARDGSMSLPGGVSAQPFPDDPVTPLNGLPPVEIAPPELPPNPSPFLPEASREIDDRNDIDHTPVRRASTPRTPAVIRFGQRLLGPAR